MSLVQQLNNLLKWMLLGLRTFLWWLLLGWTYLVQRVISLVLLSYTYLVQQLINLLYVVAVVGATELPLVPVAGLDMLSSAAD